MLVDPLEGARSWSSLSLELVVVVLLWRDSRRAPFCGGSWGYNPGADASERSGLRKERKSQHDSKDPLLNGIQPIDFDGCTFSELEAWEKKVTWKINTTWFDWGAM